MPRTLIIGFGNMDRADDGAAFHVVNRLRRHLGCAPLPEDDTGLDALGQTIDAVFLSQLTPELTEVLRDYDRIFFVDAHVCEAMEDLHCASILPESAALTFTHHISPAMILALLEALYHQRPAAHLISVRGYDFDFHRNLSVHTDALVDAAVAYLIDSDGIRDPTR